MYREIQFVSMEKIKAYYFKFKLLVFKLFSFFYKKTESNKILLGVNEAKSIKVSLPKNIQDIKNVWMPPLWMKCFEILPYTVEEYKNVFVSNDGVVFNKRSVCVESLVYEHFKSRFGDRYRYETLQNKVKEIDVPVMLVWNHWSKNNYYHWIIESLSVLMMSKKMNQQITLILQEEVPLFVSESLKAFENVNVITFGKDEVVKVKQLFSPKYPTSSGKIDVHLIQGLRRELIDYSIKINLDVAYFSKVYVSRSRQKIRKILNEELLFNNLRSNNFDIIYFEDYHFWEQIAIMRNVKQLIAPHGANLVNMLVMNESSKVIELNQKDVANATLCYWQLATELNFEYFYVPIDKENENFLLDNSSIELVLKYIEN